MMPGLSPGSYKVSKQSPVLPGLLSGHSIVKRQVTNQSREVAPNIYSFTSNGFIISLFMVTEEGVMLIDPMDVTHSEEMLANIREITAAPIKYIFYSHNHYDHIKGSQVFRDDSAGVIIVSHIEAYNYIKASAANRLIGVVVQSRRRPLLGPSPG